MTKRWSKWIPVRVQTAVVMPALLMRYAFSPAFRRLVRMHDSRQKRMEDFITRKLREKGMIP